MLISKKTRILLSMTAMFSLPIIGQSGLVHAETVNGHSALIVNDAPAGTKISIRYDSDTDEYVSYISGNEVSRVKASDWKDAWIDKNNAAINTEKIAAQNAIKQQETTRSDADKKLQQGVEELKNTPFVYYDSEKQDQITLQGENGTVVNNVANGDVNQGSSDAVNVGQMQEAEEALANETKAREQAIEMEKKNQENADAEIAKKIGSSDEITSNNYLNKENTISDNLVILDDVTHNQLKEITDLNNETGKQISAESKKRLEEDNKLAERIGTITPGTNTDYVDTNLSFSDNLQKLDQATKDLENSYNSSRDAFNDLVEKVRADRESADKALADRIGSISESDSIQYISRTGSVSENLVRLDDAINSNAELIAQETAARKDAVANLEGQINSSLLDLEHENNDVGAGVAALAGLSYLPSEYNQRINLAAAVGHYGNKNAAALGAKYNFNEDTSLNVATTVGDGHNIVSYGLSVKIGPASKLARERKKEQTEKATKAAKEALAEAKAQNQWLSAEAAYYGNTSRTLPRRYRMAKLIYDRLNHGEKVDRELISEYTNELIYIRQHNSSD